MKRNWNQFIHPGLSASQQIIILGDAPGAGTAEVAPILSFDSDTKAVTWTYAGPQPAFWAIYPASGSFPGDVVVYNDGDNFATEAGTTGDGTFVVVGTDDTGVVTVTPVSNAVVVSNLPSKFWTPESFDLETALGFTLGTTDLTTFPFVDAGNLTGLTAITFPMNTTDSIQLFSEPDIIELSGLSITTCTGQFQFSGLFALQNVLFSALISVGGDFNIESTTATTIDFSSLQSVGGVLVMSFNQVSELTFPALLTVTGDFNIHDDPVVSIIDLPLCTSLSTVTTVSDTSLVTLNIPNLLTVPNGVFNCGACSSLTTVNIGSVVIGDGGLIDFSSGALNVASINAILRRCAVSGLTSSDIELAGGTNASPTGQGIIDAASLLAAGCNVNTN